MVPDKGSLEYLGGLIVGDGRVDSEISRKIGCATADFKKLQRLWGHGGVPTTEKLRFFQSLALSRLAYGLASVWLVSVQQRCPDGFHARCLQTILRVPAAFVSTVSNAKVFARAGVVPLSQQVLHRQMVLLRRIAASPDSDPLRQRTHLSTIR